MTNSEIDLLLSTISNKSIFEYGSGSSTVWLAKHAKSVMSVEHDFDWYKIVDLHLSSYKNAKITHIPPNSIWDPKKGLDGTLEEFYEYVHAPITLSRNNDYEVFLVDGRARVECCTLISKNFPKAIIAFHDFSNRLWDGIHDYGHALKYYDIKESADTLAILTKK